MFDILLYFSLCILVLGVFWKGFNWLSRDIEKPLSGKSTCRRINQAIRGILSVLASRKGLILIKSFIIDIILQRRIFKENKIRWFMHMLIFTGFTLLVLMHGLDSILVVNAFNGYEPTLNPYLFLRNLFAAMVILGLGIAVFLRVSGKRSDGDKRGMDIYAIVIVGVIVLSGIFLESAKISSYKAFDSMVKEYGALEGEEVFELEAFWVKEFGLVSPNLHVTKNEITSQKGEEQHEMNCAVCHSSAKWAFVGFGVSKILNPLAIELDRIALVDFLWFIHILACFVGLAYLPFSKLFHIIASPLSILLNEVMNPKSADENVATRRMIEFDACTQCGACSQNCSVAFCLDGNEYSSNRYILPANKIAMIKDIAYGKYKDEGFAKLEEAAFVCSMCGRCGEVCPSHIDLPDLWTELRRVLWGRGLQLKSVEEVRKRICSQHNLLGQPNENRERWSDNLTIERGSEKSRKSVVYFAGCVTAFYPAIQSVAQSFVRALYKAGLEVKFLGRDEWCCGFPLLLGGLKGEAEEHMRHNIARIELVMKEAGATDMVVTCPACYRMFKFEYSRFTKCDVPFNVLHSTELIAQLISEEKVVFRDTDERLTVTYHDPCDLGRHGGIYDDPRMILGAIPGVDFVELTHIKENALCCGAGGLLLANHAELTSDIASTRVEEVIDTKANAVITACPACIRALTMGRSHKKGRFKILDIVQLVDLNQA